MRPGKVVFSSGRESRSGKAGAPPNSESLEVRERPRAESEPPSRGVPRRQAGRIDAHVFITILAYHLQRFRLFQLETAGDHRSWQTVNRILATHAYTTIVLPTTKDGVTRIRKAGTPEESQKRLYDIWGIDWKICHAWSPATNRAARPRGIHRLCSALGANRSQ